MASLYLVAAEGASLVEAVANTTQDYVTLYGNALPDWLRDIAWALDDHTWEYLLVPHEYRLPARARHLVHGEGRGYARAWAYAEDMLGTGFTGPGVIRLPVMPEWYVEGAKIPDKRHRKGWRREYWDAVRDVPRWLVFGWAV